MTTDIQRITPADASAKMAEGWTYVDVRTTQEFEAGHPAGAVNVPISLSGNSGMVPNGDFLSVVRASFASDTRLILGCKSGVRSMRAAQALVDAGFTNIVEMRAGWDGVRTPFGQVTEKGWLQSDLAIETGATAGRSWDHLRRRLAAE